MPEATSLDQQKHIQHSASVKEIDIENYVPEVSKLTGEWYVSETDLQFIGEGCGVLGTGMFLPMISYAQPNVKGGGGSVYTSYLHALEMLKSEGKGKMRIVAPESLSSDSNIVSNGLLIHSKIQH